MRDLRLQLEPEAQPAAIAEDPAPLSTVQYPAQPVNWQAFGKWILLLALILTLGAIAITGAISNRDKPEPTIDVNPPNPPAIPAPSQ